MDDWTLRLVWSGLLIGAGVGLYLLVNRTILKRTADLSRHLPGWQPGRPVILYFTTPDCAPCRTIQRPALRQVQSAWGDRLQVIEIDASRREDLARHWGVLSVPTTFLLDASGKPRFVNHGVTRAEKLTEQLRHLTDQLA
ncbi:thioredoxin [Bellilinea caldifistulae]|uniref:TlpA family protein disulfide reductase n=1 Tax=Bellilinea caldifistulae TaxID=360411 RepID=UPI0007840B8A|nr:thioredoxin family protein [Bellilinea caldifistulae]GAP09852.1 thioredoxin [Bellilinea caldifistulae]